jgi:hypothetical protein
MIQSLGHSRPDRVVRDPQGRLQTKSDLAPIGTTGGGSLLRRESLGPITGHGAAAAR